MKKFIPFFAILFCQTLTAQNVGIGTNTAAGKLHIKGTADTSQLVIDAFSTQSNTSPLIRLRDQYGNDILWIHADNHNSTFIGLNAGRLSGGGSNTFIGADAGARNTTGTSNTATGRAALYNNVGGLNNTANGYFALMNNTTGNDNTAIGNQALDKNSSGSGNTALGFVSLFNNTSGSSNTASGNNALFYNTTGSYNSAIGVGALQKNIEGDLNTSAGYRALYNNLSGNQNTANGSRALYANTTGNNNTANGYQALYENMSGINNTANGYQSLYINTSGSYNTANGYQTLNTNTTGSFNTALGYSADVATANLVNATAIGYNATVNASNKIRLGNTSVTVIEGQVAYSFPSDGRFKTNVSESVKGLEFILRLRPVIYNFQTQKFDKYINAPNGTLHVSNIDYTASENIRHNGFIAQEVEQAAMETGYEFDGVVVPKTATETYGLSYTQFVVPLVKALQEQQIMIEELKKANELMMKKILLLELK